MKEKSEMYGEIDIGNFLLLLDIRMNYIFMQSSFLMRKHCNFMCCSRIKLGPIQRSKLLSEMPIRLGFCSVLPAFTESHCKKCHDLF